VKFFRFLLLASLLAGLVYGYYYLEESGYFKTELIPEVSVEMQTEEESGSVLGPLEELSSFTLTRKDLRLKAQQVSGEWKILSPFTGEIQQEFLSILFKSLHDLHWERSFKTPKEELLRFGLQSPQYEITWTSNEEKKEKTLQVGFRTPDRKHLYGRWRGEDKVLLLAGNIKPVLQMPINRIRVPQLFNISPSRVIGFEVRNQDNLVDVMSKDGYWQMLYPHETGIGKKQVMDYLMQLWSSPILSYDSTGDFPEIGEESYFRFSLTGNETATFFVGDEDPKRNAYPVHSPRDGLKAWVDRDHLKLLLEIKPNVFESRSFLHIPNDSITRVTIRMRDRKFFFVSHNGLWRYETDRKRVVAYEPFEFMFPLLNELQYLKKLSLNEKSVLFLDPSEVVMVMNLTRKGQTQSGMELKFYIREDFNYLEINSQPPLYVLANDTVQRIYEILQPLVDDPNL